MGHQLHIFENGSASVRQEDLSEPMHSRIGPGAEAQAVYIGPSGLADRLRNVLGNFEKGPLVLYDIGFGIAANSLAAWDLFFSIEPSRSLEILSFETDLNGIQVALSNISHFPFLEKYEKDLRDLISKGILIRTIGKHSARWELRVGDFRESTETKPPELIFYDFYSPKTCPELWTAGIFRSLYDRTAPRRRQGLESLLLTYSSASAVKAALREAGFQVSTGPSTRAKRETTLARTVYS